MVRTYGLTHVALAVRNLDRSVKFHTGVFGARVVYRDPGFVQLQTPGTRDVLVWYELPTPVDPRPRGARL